MSWRIETANPLALMRDLPAGWAQTCIAQPPSDLPAPSLLAILDAVHRVLRKDGTLWIALAQGAGQLAQSIEAAGWLHPTQDGRLGELVLFTKRSEFYLNYQPERRHLRPRAGHPECGGTRRVARRPGTARRAWCVPAQGDTQQLNAKTIRDCLLASTSPCACGFCGAPSKKHAGLYKASHWRPGCGHRDSTSSCLVLDPFCGSGTAGEVAIALGCHYLGIEPNERTAARARARLVKGEPVEASQ